MQELFATETLNVVMVGRNSEQLSGGTRLTLSVPGNVTSEMGLALLDVADAIRPHAEVVAFLDGVRLQDEKNFIDKLPRLAGGQEARDAIQGWLELYGMR